MTIYLKQALFYLPCHGFLPARVTFTRSDSVFGSLRYVLTLWGFQFTSLFCLTCQGYYRGSLCRIASVILKRAGISRQYPWWSTRCERCRSAFESPVEHDHTSGIGEWLQVIQHTGNPFHAVPDLEAHVLSIAAQTTCVPRTIEQRTLKSATPGVVCRKEGRPSTLISCGAVHNRRTSKNPGFCSKMRICFQI